MTIYSADSIQYRRVLETDDRRRQVNRAHMHPTCVLTGKTACIAHKAQRSEKRVRQIAPHTKAHQNPSIHYNKTKYIRTDMMMLTLTR